MRTTPHLFFILLFITGCFQETIPSSKPAHNPENGPVLNFDVNQYSLNKIICNPLGDPVSPGPNDGLIAELFYRKKDQQRFYDVLSYINYGHASEKKMFFTSLNIPTRMFDFGFPTEAGNSVTNDEQETLFEYFALRFHSILKLNPEDPTGEYEFALLSDDGALMKVRDNSGVYQTIVQNDGDHPTKMACGDTLILDKESELLIQLDYYQGPRYHISLIPMWRKKTESTQSEPLCNKQGNSKYFNPNNQDQKQAYKDLLSRGWEPIPQKNWHMPAFANYNPCTQGTPPVIDLIESEIEENYISVRWRTNIESTSQVMYRKVGDSEYTITTSDNQLYLVHQVGITPDKIELDTEYEIILVSISPDFGKTKSEPIYIRTTPY